MFIFIKWKIVRSIGFALGLLIFQGSDAFGQNLFVNGSMNGPVGTSRVPTSWSINSSTPDINNAASDAHIPNAGGVYPWTSSATVSPTASPDGGTFESTVCEDGGINEGFQQTISGLIVGKQYRFRYYWARTPCVRQGSDHYNANARPNAVVTGMTGYANPTNSGAPFWTWQTVDQVLTATATTATFNMRPVYISALNTSTIAGYISWDGFKLEPINSVPVAVNDMLTGQVPGSPATIANLLINDTDLEGPLSPGNISFVAPAGATGVTTDGQGDVTGFTVPGEGTWSLNSSTGAVTFTPQAGFTGDPTPIRYKVKDAAGAVSNTATITIDFNSPVTVGGTVYNDNNGMTGGPDGPPVSGVTVSLFAIDGTTVLATTATDANGNYSFPNQVPGNYIIGVTPPGGYQNVSATDNTTPADGRSPITVGSTAVAGINFGINQPPVAVSDTIVNQTEGMAATIANLLANDTDPDGGTLSPDSISLVAPGNATSIATDPQGDITGFAVPGQGIWSLNSSTGALTFTPQSGFTGDPTPVVYSVTDAAGLSSAPAIAFIDFRATPDLTPVVILPINQLGAGATRDFIVRLTELRQVATASPIGINIVVPSGYSISFTGSTTQVALLAGGQYTVSNSQWNAFPVSTTSINLQSANSFAVTAGGQTAISFKLTRTTVLTGSQGNITVKIYADPNRTYDSVPANNFYSRIITAN
ncbi:Ig-like domain-containing protein [Taibaiella koreensis]|uniref:Ig-like domain-containing protein n=1 Tax=Taibaiella koreensis TaxID=1268548 RepID=UPI000E5A00F3|nr:SdrD B-like domain-containing protein [Taibaiella koreensis]